MENSEIQDGFNGKFIIGEKSKQVKTVKKIKSIPIIISNEENVQKYFEIKDGRYLSDYEKYNNKIIDLISKNKFQQAEILPEVDMEKIEVEDKAGSEKELTMFDFEFLAKKMAIIKLQKD